MYFKCHQLNSAVSSNNRLRGSYSDGKAVQCYFPVTDGFQHALKLKYLLYSSPDYENIEQFIMWKLNFWNLCSQYLGYDFEIWNKWQLSSLCTCVCTCISLNIWIITAVRGITCTLLNLLNLAGEGSSAYNSRYHMDFEISKKVVSTVKDDNFS